MIVTLLNNSKLISLTLPHKKKGVYWIEDTDSELLCIEAVHGEWIGQSNANMWFVDEHNRYISEIRLYPFNLYTVYSKQKNEFFYIIVEPRVQMGRYMIHSVKEITIGRKKHNDIVLQSDVISSIHVKLHRRANQWILTDADSVNGVYVNNVKVSKTCVIQPGDTIYIMGFRLIMGKGMIAISNPQNLTIINTEVFSPFQKKRLEMTRVHTKDTIEYFTPNGNSPKIHYSIEQCKDIIQTGNNSLWNCSTSDKDFLNECIGDNIYINLLEYPIIALNGNVKESLAFCRGLLLQMMTYYSYRDVKVVVCIDESNVHEFHGARWLPHAWDDEKEQSFFVTTMDEKENVLACMRRQMQLAERKGKQQCPHYVVFCFTDTVQGWLDIQNVTGNVSVVAYRGMSTELCHCDIELRLNGDNSSILYANDNKRLDFVPKIYVGDNIDLLYLQLANTHIDMNNNVDAEYFMVELYVPLCQNTYYIRIPRNCRIGETISFMEKQILELNDNYICSKGRAVLCDGEEGFILNVSLTPEQQGILNGTRLMLI